MSIRLVEERLDALLSDATSRIVLLTGAWGSGKTHQWRAARARFNGEKPRHAYVSLFGLGSVPDLRRRIAEESVASYEIPEGGRLADIVGVGGLKIGPLQLLKFLPLVPVLAKLDQVAQDLSFSLVRNTVVCLDDLERAGANLKLADVLGLANYLKEECGCRVLLISNHEKLGDDDKGVLKNYFEKVVDERIDLAPSLAEASAIAFGSVPDGVTKLLRTRAAQLKIGNVRVLRQLQRLALPIYNELQAMHPRVVEEAIQALALFGACHLLGNDRLPTTDHLFELEDNWVHYATREKEDGEATDRDRELDRWSELLNEYQYQKTSSMDAEVGKSVVRGFIDASALRAAAAPLSEQFGGDDLQSELDNAITSFWHDINADSNATLESVAAAARKAAPVISLSGINRAWWILTKCGRADEARALLTHFIDVNQERPAVFEAVNGHFQDQDKSEFGDLVRQEAAKLRVLPTFEQSLDRIRLDEEWSRADVARVCEATKDDVEAALRHATRANFRSRVRVLLDLKGLSGATEGAQRVSSATVDVLRHWAEQDPTMAVRLRHYLPRSADAARAPTPPARSLSE